MKIYRLYTGNDGRSQIEEMREPPSQEAPQDCTQVFFRELAAGTFMDWHPAPRRQYVILLQGEMEIGLQDGTVHPVHTGDAVLASDTSGPGHTTRVVGDGPAVNVVVPLAGG